MRNYVATLLFVLALSFIVSFLLASFGSVTFNIAEWGAGARVFVIICTTLSGLVYTTVYWIRHFIQAMIDN